MLALSATTSPGRRRTFFGTPLTLVSRASWPPGPGVGVAVGVAVGPPGVAPVPFVAVTRTDVGVPVGVAAAVAVAVGVGVTCWPSARSGLLAVSTRIARVATTASAAVAENNVRELIAHPPFGRPRGSVAAPV